ncbi:MAG: bacteriohemerythrin [Gammaproteobacteria bacterium]|jgi:hemerythrin-like metal-binding protein|nr:bacteriohemerythrin [Gammaproteobacteria bacterium]MBT4078811.1 bacteriohemerythrin [Gammaproteobacteria bacterium]MBT4195946.1 bacteriohemerythrin [Gammaproteobacteria bacterium]MBT4451582.1 bacteriohemerythrin [Gammaproteobacteria bacterium]MBT4860176.1 bacteriohemerythrin [Gammaproteobacteria bacterium]
MFFSRLSLYTLLGLTIVSTVVVIISLQSFISYQSTKKQMIEIIHSKSANSLHVLQKNMAGFIESYAVNEYDKLIFNEMTDNDYLAIIVEDYNMGKVIEEASYISGKIRDSEWNAIDYDVESIAHLKQIKTAFYTEQAIIQGQAGEKISTVKIYISDRYVQLRLNEIIREKVVSTAILILILTLFLFFSIRYFTIKPLKSIIKSISNTDHEGIPVNPVATFGTKETVALANAINLMIETIKSSRVKLRRTQKMDAIGQLAGGIAHDFNNILGIILGNINFLKHEVGNNEKALKRINAVDKATKRAARLTRELLGFSREQAIDTVNSNINSVIKEMDSLIIRSITPEVEVDKYFAKDLWLTEINLGDFQDALINLILNARDAMPDGGQLTLETKNSILDANYCKQNHGLTPGEYIQLSVSDTGNGISTDKQEKIFEPFYTTKPEGKGTGLGLAMVFSFVNRSHGHIKVYSEPGIGTTIRLYLPRNQGEEPETEVTVLQTDPLPGGNETILAVDDEEALLEIARESLESLGYSVITATDGKNALKQLLKYPSISLLFSDVVMPGGINGFELAEQASAHRPDLSILLTSGFTKKAVAHNGQARFTSNLLSKPYSQSELAQRVRTVLGDSISNAQDKKQQQQTSIDLSNFIARDDTFLVGIDSIDDDHRKLMNIFERVNQLKESGVEQDVLKSILSELEDYTRYHFRREETVMKTCDYPDFYNHLQVHQLLIKQLVEKKRHLQQNSLTAQELATFLTSWLVDHIQTMDKAFAPYCVGKEDVIKQALDSLANESDKEYS